ncbi:hypothetical protein [Methylibium petroleiphilum]|uniref:hypothetical protein n=1 Tax=Methylibium petroleiphilum TaxID=105560 RepID=UPI003D2A753A
MSRDAVGALTVFCSETAKLAKEYSLAADGELVKRSSAQMSSGTFEVREFDSVAGLAQLIEGLTTQQALCASLPHDGSTSGRIVCQATLTANPGALARSKAHFGLKPRPGLVFIDHDSVAGEALSRDELWCLLLQAAPGVSESGALWLPSGSSHVCNGVTDLTGLRGQHVYVLLQDTSDAPRVVKTIAARLWLLGQGRIELSSSGSMLLRCPIDTAPTDGARLVFSAGADCKPPLEQRRGAAVVLSAGGFLDSRAMVPDLTREEMDRYVSLVESAKSAKIPEALTIRATHRAATISKRLPAMLAAGVGAAEAEARISAAVDAAYGGTLLSDFELTAAFSDGRHQTVTVAEVLKNREQWNEVDVLVPGNEDHRGGAPDARLFLRGSSPIVYSLDGDQVFRLRQQSEVVRSAKGSRGELVEALCRVVAEQPDVFLTDAGPALLIDGRLVPLTAQRLQNLVGSRVALMTRGANGKDQPTDLHREAADLVLAAMST